MTRPKLLAASHDFSLTGAPIALFNVLNGLKAGYDIQVVSQTEGPLRGELHRAGIDAQVIPNVLNDINICESVLASFDLLFANTLNCCLPIHAAHHLGKPSIWYIHEGHFGVHFLQRYQPVMPQAFELVSKVIVLCQFSRDLYEPWLGNTPVEIVPLGVQNQDLPPTPPTDRGIQVLQIGSFEHRKGQDIALAAFRMLNDDRFVLHFIGNVLDQNYRYQVVNHFADVRNVRYWSVVPKEDALRLIGDCDVLIQPSRDEVTPLVILEAMALARAVIASRVCGVPEMIEDDVTGFLFDKENVQQLAELLRRVGPDEELRRKVGLQAREFQRQHRTLEQCSARFDRILRDLLENRAEN
jgi:glycosyltransferase involved in cell wall biosynthesis